MGYLIEINNVSKKYNSDYALKNINLKISENDIYGIIGESGAGKSTLLRILNLLEKPTSGSVFIKNKNLLSLKNSDLRILRRKIGMIFQGFNLLANRNVEQNIALPLEILGISKKEIKDKIKNLIKLVNLEGKEKHYPHQLSGGQKQRVGIARALANDPFILLCDEATSALDPKNTHDILELLKKIQTERNLTVILITHEMEVLYSICNKIAVLEHGEIIEHGDLKTVLSTSTNEITNKFLRNSLTTNINIPNNHYLDMYLDDAGIYMSLLETLKKEFDLKELNIIEANIKSINNQSQGTLLLQALSNKNTINEDIYNNIVNFLKIKNIPARVII